MKRTNYASFIVGALERLLERCTDSLGEKNVVAALDSDAVHRAAESMAARGLRVLGLASNLVAKASNVFPATKLHVPKSARLSGKAFFERHKVEKAQK